MVMFEKVTKKKAKQRERRGSGEGVGGGGGQFGIQKDETHSSLPNRLDP